MGWIERLAATAVLGVMTLATALAQSPAGANTSAVPGAVLPTPGRTTVSAAPVPSPAPPPPIAAVPPPTAIAAAAAIAPPPQPIGNPAPAPPNCYDEIPGARLGAPSAVVVQLDPDTLWRPRGTEVRFTISGTSGPPPQIRRVSACFRWQLAQNEAMQDRFKPSGLVRSVPNTDGSIEYGALIPQLKGATHTGVGPSHRGAVEYMAVYTVPVAAMQVLVELADGTWFAVVLPVGITQVPTGLLILLVCLAVTIGVLWTWAPASLLREPVPDGQPVPAERQRVKWWNVSRHALAIISTSNGVASLSQFQIILWSLVVGSAAVYVMALSGNLIAISTGTLTLLSIAGGTAVLARVKPIGAPDPKLVTSKTPPPATLIPAATTVVTAGTLTPTVTVTHGATLAAAVAPITVLRAPPLWSQMLVDDADDPEIDVTRVQMLIFTLISAAFVAITVASTYSIPEIPQNFLLLMGISNGVYLAGRQIPSTPKGTSA